jgi:Haem-NO-binding
MYGVCCDGIRSAKELLLKLDDIHVATTRTIPNARPPRFKYEDVDENTLIMEYQSSRGLMPFFTGLLRGLAAHYGEKADISSLGVDKVHIVFSKA